jgi:hypothetical protein
MATARVRTGVAGAVACLLLGVAACSGGGDDDGGAGGPGDDDGGSTAERAPAGLVQVLMPDDVTAEREALSAAVGTEAVRVSLVGRGEAEEIGQGRAARRPAEGERFVVVELVQQPIDPATDTISRLESAEAAQRGAATYSVQVGDGAPVPVSLDAPSYTPLPIDLDDPPQPPAAEPAGAPRPRLLVVAAPDDADRIDLVVGSAGLEQRLSLLTGDAGGDNVAVLARENRRLHAPVPAQDVSSTRTDFGLSTSDTVAVGVPSAALHWSVGSDPTRQTAPPGRAILQVMLDGGGFIPSLASELRMPDGTLVQPMPTEDPMLASIVPAVQFDVPADFTAGTLVLGKDYSWDVPTGGTMAADFAGTVEYAIAIPAEAP